MAGKTSHRISPDDEAALRREGDLISYARLAAGITTRANRLDEQVACPRCGAPPRQSCTALRGRHLSAGVHEVRVQAAAERSQELPKPARPVGAWPATRTTRWPSTPPST